MEHAGGYIAGVGRSSAAGFLSTSASTRVAGVPRSRVACSRGKETSVAKSCRVTSSDRSSRSWCSSAPINDSAMHASSSTMVSDEVPPVVSLQLLEFDAQKDVARYALTQIQPRVVSFEAQVGQFGLLLRMAVMITKKLAELYESNQQSSKEAQMLSGIDSDSGIRMLDDTNKLSKCVQIARLYLEASFLVTNSHQEVLNSQHMVYYARILDLKRRFLEVALGYYDISEIEQEETDENALEQALSAAVTCAILAGAGGQSCHILATLYKDERCSKLKIYPILQKVYLERILRKPEIDAFAEELRPHQVEPVIHFDDDKEKLQQWDQQIAAGYTRVKFANEVRAAPCSSLSPSFTNSFLSPASCSRRGKTRVFETRCNATRAPASAPAPAPVLDWENVARVCLVCALLHKAGYFKLPAPTQSKSPSQSGWKAQMVRIQQKVTFLLLLECLVVGCYAAMGDKRMKLIVDTADKGVKCYKVIEEITKIFK